MIDERISSLLIRSSEIDSKLDSLQASSHKSRSSAGRRRDSDSAEVSDSRPHLREPHASELGLRISSKNQALSSLVDVIKELHKEIQEMKEEQKKTSDQVNEIHKHLMNQGIGEDLDLSDA
jgi:chromosome segregation ATPase